MLVRLRNAQHKSNAILQQNPFNCRWPLLPCAWKGCFRASPLRRALTLLAPNEKQKATLEAFAHLDLRVGEIKAVEKHPRADKLYIESIDVGKGESPRIIVSGLVRHIESDVLLGSKCIVVTNLKPAKLQGVVSNGMILCASSEDGLQVELLRPPESSQAGDRVGLFCDEEYKFKSWLSEDEAVDSSPLSPGQVHRKKSFRLVQQSLRTTGQAEAALQLHDEASEAGETAVFLLGVASRSIKCDSLANADIS